MDNAVDLTLGAFTIKKDAKNYVSFKVVDNAFVIDKLVKGDMEVTGTALDTAKDGLKNVVLNANYDIGFAVRFLYNGIIIKHQKTEPTYTKTSLFLCEKRRFFMARREKGVVPIIYFEKERGKSF